MATIIPRILRMGNKIETKSVNLVKFQKKCFSNAVLPKIVDGINGEKIITSTFKPLVYPEITIQDYIWKSVQNYSEFTALECGITGRKYTYAQVRDYANCIARSLLNMGIQPGDVIALVVPNLPECPIAFLGCLEAGIIVTTINPIYTADEIAYQLTSSDSKAVITSSMILSNVTSAVNKTIPNAKIIVINDYVQPIPDDVIPFDNLITKGKSLPGVATNQCSPDDVAILPYSSGTTGLPKGVMLTHRNIVSNVEMLKNTVNEEMFRTSSESYQDVLPAVLPMYHIYGISMNVIAKLSIGGKLITLPKFTPESFIKVLEENKITMMSLVPPIFLFLSSSNLVKKKHIENIKYIVSGAAPISSTDVQRFYNKFELNSDIVQFSQGYGLTESSPLTFFETSNKKFSSIGKPISGCEARLVDPVTKRDVISSGQTGELWVRGPNIMKGYWKNKKATDETLINGWLLTGDIAFYDEELDFYITDRLKELIKVKGFQVAPAELEAILRTHPNIEEAGVIGIPNERYGEVPKAFVVLKNQSNASSEDIQKFVKGKVSEFKELRGGVQFIDILPKNSSGKILRNKLKEEYCK